MKEFSRALFELEDKCSDLLLNFVELKNFDLFCELFWICETSWTFSPVKKAQEIFITQIDWKPDSFIYFVQFWGSVNTQPLSNNKLYFAARTVNIKV